MTTIALPRPVLPHQPSSPMALSPVLSLEIINTSAACPLPIPNKHLPICPTGPSPSQSRNPDTPPASPPTKHNEIPTHSLLYPPDSYTRISSKSGTIYSIDAEGVAAALDHISSQPLPKSAEVFPWMHGLHAQNQVQQAFFIARRRALRKTPTCLRGITIVKADGDLSCSRLKGAISPDELMDSTVEGQFRDIDPKDGFSVRNFQIQACKTALVSDVIVYGEDEVETRKVAWKVVAAQQSWRELNEKNGTDLPWYNTFICTSPYDDFERHHQEIVSSTSRGHLTGNVMDFFYQERYEMSSMTRASEIAPNVWLGPTPDPSVDPSLLDSEDRWDVLVECNDLGRLNPAAFESLTTDPSRARVFLEFPSSGSIMPTSWATPDTEALLSSIQWLHAIATGVSPAMAADVKDNAAPPIIDVEGDSQMTASFEAVKPRRILIHCTDGYTETSLLALAYYMYATGCTVSQAYHQLHTTKKRNFFSYPSDVALLNILSPRLLENSPSLSRQDRCKSSIAALIKEEPRWLSGMDGSLPSRITEYMYLGNLNHANNPSLLRELGIGQLLSVGELANWTEKETNQWGAENVLRIQGVQDNGVDELWHEIPRCLDFINSGRNKGTATLVHCRVGVSRSATICIAEIMQSMDLSYPRAYCFVRARRLNVIIQPHLRFSYELLKWEEEMGRRRCETQGGKWTRELEWETIAREIANMNRPYSR